MGLGWSLPTAIPTDPSARTVPALGRDDRAGVTSGPRLG